MEAFYGEILTSCEKLRSLIVHGKQAIQSEKRAVPLLLFLKKARVEYYPFGVIGIIIPSVRLPFFLFLFFSTLLMCGYIKRIIHSTMPFPQLPLPF